jgi:hypothetical protein
MVNLVWLQLIQKFHQVNGVAEVSVMQKESHAVDVRIGVKMINTGGVKCAGAANDPMNFVPFFQQ